MLPGSTGADARFLKNAPKGAPESHLYTRIDSAWMHIHVPAEKLSFLNCSFRYTLRVSVGQAESDFGPATKVI